MKNNKPHIDIHNKKNQSFIYGFRKLRQESFFVFVNAKLNCNNKQFTPHLFWEDIFRSLLPKLYLKDKFTIFQVCQVSKWTLKQEITSLKHFSVSDGGQHLHQVIVLCKRKKNKSNL